MRRCCTCISIQSTNYVEFIILVTLATVLLAIHTLLCTVCKRVRIHSIVFRLGRTGTWLWPAIVRCRQIATGSITNLGCHVMWQLIMSIMCFTYVTAVMRCADSVYCVWRNTMAARVYRCWTTRRIQWQFTLSLLRCCWCLMCQQCERTTAGE